MFSQGLAVFCRCAANDFFKDLIKITCVIKTNRACNLGDRFVCLAVHAFGGFHNAVFHEVLDRGETDCALKAAAALTLTDKD